MDLEWDVQANTFCPQLISDKSADAITANEAAAWMQNRLDGRIHPALNANSTDVTYTPNTHVFSSLRDDGKIDLCVNLKDLR